MCNERRRSSTRRAFLVGVGGTAALGAAPVVNAQGTETKFTSVAIPDSAPTFGESDYVGLFVHVAGPGGDKPSQGVGNCPFAGDSQLVTWNAVVVDKTGNRQQAETTLHAKQGAQDMQGGKLFIVDEQRNCGNGFVQLSLEQVGASSVEVQTSPTKKGEGTEGAIEGPGFGPVAGVAGLLGAGWLAKRRSE